MCLIAISPKGTDPYSDFFINGLKNSAAINKDGYGYAFKKDNTKAVFFSKGFTSISSLIDELKSKKLNSDDELIVHLRMASAGKVAGYNSHPFELNYNSGADVSVNCIGKTTIFPVMFHNGTLNTFVNTKEDTSDSYNFANKFMKIKEIWKFLVKDKVKFDNAFRMVLGTSRFAFLSKETEMILLGDFHTTQGYIYSARSYEEPTRPFNVHRSIPDRTPAPIHTRNNTPAMNIVGDTKVIKINTNNFTDFILKSTCFISANKIEKDTKFYIRKYSTETCTLEYVDKPAVFTYIQTDIINSCFIKLLADENKDMYIDYIKLYHIIEPTKSAIKKLFNKVVEVSNKNSPFTKDKQIEHKYKDRRMSFRCDAVLEFLKDHSAFVDKLKIDLLILSSSTNTKEEISCDC